MLHVEHVCSAVLHFLDNGVEAAAASAAGYGDGVYVELYPDDAAFPVSPYLVCHVKHEGGVHAVVELQRHIHIVSESVGYLADVVDVTWRLSTHAKGGQSTADDVGMLCRETDGVVGRGAERHEGTAFLELDVIVHRDGVVAGSAGVDVDAARHAREVRVTVDRGDTSVVVMKDDLGEVDVGDGLQQHVQSLDVDVVDGVVVETSEVAVDLDTLLVGREELLGLVEGAGVAGRLVAGRTHRLVGVGRHVVERRLLVEVQTLHTVGRRHVVPHEDVPEAPVVSSVEGVARDGGRIDAGMWGVRLRAGVVAAEHEHLRLCVADVSKELEVGLVPAVVPLSMPVVDAVDGLVVPVSFEVELHHREVEVDVATIKEVERWLRLTAHKPYEPYEPHSPYEPYEPHWPHWAYWSHAAY